MAMTEATEFREVLPRAIDEALLVLGESVRHVLYYYAETRYGVKREEIPDSLEAFHKALQGTFGAGAKIIENLIARNVYSKLGLTFDEHENWMLADYLDYAKNAAREN